jgi:hypothetical protein
MAGVFGEQVTIGQANGPDVELVVHGDEHYARYETPDGYSAVYDENLGLFTYALLRDGRFHSSGVPVGQAPPPGAQQHAQESAEVRIAKAAERQAARDDRARRS